MNDLILGVFPDTSYTENEIILPEDAVMLLLTDGVTEAFNEQQEEFGLDRTRNVLRKYIGKPATVICQNLLDELNSYRGKASQSDDITAVIITS